MTPITFTNEDFLAFEKYVHRWVCRLGLTEWNLTVMHDQIGGAVNAQTQYNTVSKGACIRLTKVSEGDYNMITDPNLLALHEVLHLLLADFCETTAKLGSPVHDLVVGQEHAVIQRLMNALPKE